VSIALATGETTPLTTSVFEPALAMGHLFVARAAGIFAARFDATRIAIDGGFQLVGDSVSMDATSAFASFGVSEAGVLAYRPGRPRSLQFQWLGADGRVLEAVGDPGDYSSFDLSPDGSRIVTRLTAARDDQPTNAALRVIDLARGVTSAVNIPAGPLSDPVWTADGTRILYRLGDSMLRQSPLGQTRDVVANTATYPDHASPDGRSLIVGVPLGRGGFALSIVPSDGAGPGASLAAGQSFIADEGRFSPDGRLISFQTTQSGRNEIYVARFPLTDERWQVSSAGGVQARWAPDGRSLYYVSLTGRLMRVPMEPGAPERVGRPQDLFDLGVGTPSPIFEQYAVHGDRFLVLRPLDDAQPTPTVVINNWRPDVLRPSAAPAAPRP
jgi:dipeptidyl aminopeptidase/acylaminoacyl peptidase